MADGRSRKAAATKKAAAVRARAARDTGGKRDAQRIDESRSKPYNPEVKMGIASPGVGRWPAGLKNITNTWTRAPKMRLKRAEPKPFVPKKLSPAPKPIEGTSKSGMKASDRVVRRSQLKNPPTRTISEGRNPGPELMANRITATGPARRVSNSNARNRTTRVLKDPPARWEAGQARAVAAGAPVARMARSAARIAENERRIARGVEKGTGFRGRAAKAAATKKKK